MSSMSKRQQARNERELHDLLSAPGNSQCADCSAKNPSWASWNLGIFLCMRCASIHRKLGTHISKVKSLSMDTWTADQVENMKQIGNTSSNQIYNPKNKKADMPLDADEVDSAMERFIRKKYQEKSLLDGRPAVPSRDSAPQSTYSRPQAESPPPPLPPKKGKFFGFGLRASSSSLPLTKHDKKKLPKEPRVDSTFHIPNDDYTSMSRMADARFDMNEAELQQKLATLRDMGFTETERNADLLRRLNGNVERTIERLVQLGPSKDARSAPRKDQSSSAVLGQKPSTTFPDAPVQQPSEPPYNPFTQMTNQPPIGLSMAKPQEASSPSIQPYASNNPFGHAVQPQVQTQLQPQPQTGLEQSLQSMQLAQPLFPHSTGGYPTQPPVLQDPRFQYSMTPPALPTQHQQNYVASPSALTANNPFFQPSPASAHSTGSNPFHNQPTQNPAAAGPSSPSLNPFLGLQTAPSNFNQQQNSGTAGFNPFGIPPQRSPLQTSQQPQTQIQSHDIFGAIPSPQIMQPSQPLNPFQTQPAQQPTLAQQQYANAQNAQSYPNLQYGQTQSQLQPELQNQSSFQQQASPFQQQLNQHPQLQSQQMSFQQSFGQKPQSLASQQTGRYDKTSIMALFNQPLASIPEPAPENAPSQQFYSPRQQQISPAPMGDIFGTSNNMDTAKRSATMPISLQSMHSAGGGGNRNPFLMNNTSPTASAGNTPAFYAGNFAPAPQGQTIAARHTSAESMSISNLESGRYSPDAFANLSARQMR
ncbi:uncharacterized protein A1O9_11434 [Exophiala aquamarina CBS 119918]|uniref:Arf-GAP domain-containing protein n=1 Tax=Exophiala aquamarina CBS 119918 TaxID=1182545 RepID=A0A072NYB8_9EURO|nr:uncharacterized protein A1O9_11434 [Exophiala aquamarina CBS 119918]KEF52591.1 hypothetical protein A1O9_11434 [Exophiala aquamarina CBS 119918]